MRNSFFYFGLVLIFASGTFYSSLVGSIIAEISYATIITLAPGSFIPELDAVGSHADSIFFSIYGAPFLIIGLILVRKHRK